jgi:hypothetical protein
MIKTKEPPVKQQLSSEAVKLINEIWDCMELLANKRPNAEELRRAITVDGIPMDEFKLRQLRLKLWTKWQDKSAKPEHDGIEG